LNEAFPELSGAMAAGLAYRLLASGELSVKQVAWRAGYAHVSNFSLAFTRRFGHPPTGTPAE